MGYLHCSGKAGDLRWEMSEGGQGMAASTATWSRATIWGSCAWEPECAVADVLQTACIIRGDLSETAGRDRGLPRTVQSLRRNTMETRQDMKSANRMYESFIANLKWSVPLIAAIAALVVIMIAT